jgi:hypothetical protein
MNEKPPKGYKKYLEYKETIRLIALDILKWILYLLIKFGVPIIVVILVYDTIPQIGGFLSLFIGFVVYRIIDMKYKKEDIWITPL